MLSTLTYKYNLRLDHNAFCNFLQARQKIQDTVPPLAKPEPSEAEYQAVSPKRKVLVHT